MAKPSQTFIAGKKTGDHWRDTKLSLIVGGVPELWRQTFDEFFRTRLQLRYLGPIKVLQDTGEAIGEGFSIAAIQCSIIEFLESTVQGLKYRYVENEADLKPFEYSSSAKLFIAFLTKREPFKSAFTKKIASDFYRNVRCALLHEARTRDAWLIRAGDPAGRVIDPHDKILFRDSFQDALLKFVDSFGAQLPTSVDLQEAFIRKFDDLAE
jgi:hypothetical protein